MRREGFDPPVVDVAIEARSKADNDRLAVALERLSAEDSRLRVSTDEVSGQVIISGADEHHLDAVVERLRGDGNLAVAVGAPQVAYRETITRKVDHEFIHQTSSGTAEQFARISFRIEPTREGAGHRFLAAIAADVPPFEFVAAVQRGVESAMGSGVLMGFPFVDLVFTLTGARGYLDSPVSAFEIAGRSGFYEALTKAGPKILEPIMAVEVTALREHFGEIARDLAKRRATAQEIAPGTGTQLIRAQVPIANMFGYANSLRALSLGTARYSMRFHHYAPLPDPLPNDHGPFGGAMAMRA